MIETKFKHTDIGLVPEEWEAKTLSEVCSFQTDNILTSDINMSEYVGTENMVPNRGGVLSFVGTLPYYRVRHYLKNDVLTSNIRPYLKKIWLSTREGGCSSDVLVIRANNKFLIPSYLYSVISSDSFFAYSNDNAKGTKMPRGDKDAISKFTFAIPPISEQQRIASALMNIDALISNLDKLIAKKQAVKKGAMQELLTGKKRLPGFKGEWKVKTLIKVARLKSGKNIDLIVEKQGIYPCFGGNGIRTYISRYSHEGTFPIIGRQGELCGNVQLAMGKFYATEHAVVCRPYSDIDAIWLYYQLVMTNLNQYKTGNAQPGLSVEKIEQEVTLQVPHIDEQRAIAHVLSTMDSDISMLEQKRNKYRQIKQGMMRDLLTGRIRLTD